MIIGALKGTYHEMYFYVQGFVCFMCMPWLDLIIISHGIKQYAAGTVLISTTAYWFRFAEHPVVYGPIYIARTNPESFCRILNPH